MGGQVVVHQGTTAKRFRQSAVMLAEVYGDDARGIVEQVASGEQVIQGVVAVRFSVGTKVPGR